VIVKAGYRPGIEPFDMTGVEWGADGVLGYMGLGNLLVDMFHDAVDAQPDGIALVAEPDQALVSGPAVVVDGPGPKDLAAIFYTSGSPKGALTTHENFLSNCETCRRVIGILGDVRLMNLISVPMFGCPDGDVGRAAA